MPFDGLTEVGLKLQVTFVGSVPGQVNATVPLYPLLGVTLMTYGADEPALTVIVVGLAPTEKSGATITCVNADDDERAKLASPLYAAVML